MPHLMLKDLPRYDCLLEITRRHPDLDPSACETYLNLLRAGDEAYARSEQFLNGHGMTPGRFTVMMLMYDKVSGEALSVSPADLAEKAGVTRATITGLVDTLEREGYVTRQHDEHDRRMMLIKMTPQGVAHLESILPGYFRQMGAQIAPLDEAERRTLVRILTKLAGRVPASVDAEAATHS